MNDKKQIEEMAKILNECCNVYDEQGNHIRNKCSECEEWSHDNHCCCSYGRKEAETLYNAGYRKQSEAKWFVCGMFDDFLKCSSCGYQQPWQTATEYKYCPDCGAKMEGGAE